MKHYMSWRILAALFIIVFVFWGCGKQNPISSEAVVESPIEGLLAKPNLAVPTGITVVVTGTSVTVSWNAVTNAVGYQVTFTGTNAPPGEPNTTALSVTRNGVLPGNYTVKIRALAAPGGDYNSSPYSDDIPFIILAPPPDQPVKLATPVVTAVVTYTYASANASASPQFIWPPNNKLVTVTFSGTVATGTGTVSVSWGAIEHAVGYQVTFGASMVTTTSTSWSTSGLAPGSYTVQVVALAEAGSTEYSNSDPGSASFTIQAGSASYVLTDEYGEFSYTGSITGGTYSIPLSLRASRNGYDLDGRPYTFTVTATNGGGATVTATALCIVLHDQRK